MLHQERPRLADRFPAIVVTASRIRASSFLLDGEAVIPRADGMSDFNALRSQEGRNHAAVLFAFDLLAHDGEDLRPVPLIARKVRLAELLGKTEHAIQLVDHLATTARPCSSMPAGWGWRASSRSGPMRPIAAGRRRCGSNRRTGERGGAARARGGGGAGLGGADGVRGKARPDIFVLRPADGGSAGWRL